MKNKDFYDEQFFNNHLKGSYSSAKRIVPIIIKLTKPRNVIDVGCGIGTWLKVMEEANVKDILGLDGDYVNKEKLLISRDKFISIDLSKPFNIDKKFDIALCLEVAEHIHKKNASIFIKSLVKTSDLIVFSAAAPLQGGTNHLNEQWPSFWESLFKNEGFVMLDPFRKEIINYPDIQWWYKQNIFLFVKESKYEKSEKLKKLPVFNDNFILIHRSVFNKNTSIFYKLKRKLLKSIRNIGYG